MLFGLFWLCRTQSPADVGARLIGETIRKPVGENAFGDLLGTQGFVNFGKKDIGPRTMAEMKRVEMAKEIDPVRLVVSTSVDIMAAPIVE